jgi:uncharacterized membrane protein YkvA (DUF1232 family)
MEDKMLKALEYQLRALAENDDGKFRKAIEERLGKKPTDEQLKAIKEFIFLLPPILRQLSVYRVGHSVPAPAKQLSGLILTYVFHPHDLIPETRYGFFGYIDDAYLVVSSFLKLENLALKNWQDMTEPERDLFKRASELITVPRLVIPEAVKKIDSAVEKWLSGDSFEFSEFFSNI